MPDFIKRNLIAIGIGLGTIILLVGGVFLFSKSGSTVKKVSNDLLIGKDSYQTDPKAQVTLVEFGDYECPACATYNPLVKQLLADLPGQVNFVFRNFPLSQHANANISSYAAESAGLQGKFWEMHDKLYDSQNDWAQSSDAKSIFLGYAKDLGLNVAKFTEDLDSQKIKDKVSKDEADGNLLNINATPTFYVNGVKVESLPGSYNAFKTIITDVIKNNPLPTGSPDAYHIHFDLKVYLNGKAVDFSQSKYQESKDNPLSPDIHFHDGNGKVVHIHKEGATIKELFDSFKLTIPENTETYVNGKKVANILSYIPQDLDQILIGSSNFTSVSNDACIYSLKCPARGTPPPEDCVGGLGSGCTTD